MLDYILILQAIKKSLGLFKLSFLKIILIKYKLKCFLKIIMKLIKAITQIKSEYLYNYLDTALNTIKFVLTIPKKKS